MTKTLDSIYFVVINLNLQLTNLKACACLLEPFSFNSDANIPGTKDFPCHFLVVDPFDAESCQNVENTSM